MFLVGVALISGAVEDGFRGEGATQVGFEVEEDVGFELDEEDLDDFEGAALLLLEDPPALRRLYSLYFSAIFSQLQHYSK